MAATQIYSVQTDQPWMSSERASSEYSDSENGAPSTTLDPKDLPGPLRIQKPNPGPTQQTTSAPSRAPPSNASAPPDGSRHRILNQVRSMLKPSRLAPTRDNVRWDEYSGELSEHGKAPHIKPSTYKPPPPQTALEIQRRALRQTSNPRDKEGQTESPVAETQAEKENTGHLHPNSAVEDTSRPVSIVSSIANVSTFYDETSGPAPATVNNYSLPETPTVPASAIKRKPVATSPTTTSPTDQINLQHTDLDDMSPKIAQPDSKSHFSWTTYATSNAGNLTSSTTTTPRLPDHSPKDNQLLQIGSRFSWSTIATSTATPHLQPDSSPSIPPPPPIPEEYKPAPPVQSILSRSRPIHRADRDEWNPSPIIKRPLTSTSTGANDPPPTTSRLHAPLNVRPKSSNATTSSSKRSHASGKTLPLPPSLHPSAAGSTPSRLETLLHESQDKAHQRANMEKVISELEKIESASPLAVTFAQVKDTQRKLREHRATLAAIMMEQQEIGIAIARARRIEGEEANLWVSRVAVW